jgi:hypothetical protein
MSPNRRTDADRSALPTGSDGRTRAQRFRSLSVALAQALRPRLPARVVRFDSAAMLSGLRRSHAPSPCCLRCTCAVQCRHGVASVGERTAASPSGTSDSPTRTACAFAARLLGVRAVLRAMHGGVRRVHAEVPRAQRDRREAGVHRRMPVRRTVRRFLPMCRLHGARPPPLRVPVKLLRSSYSTQTSVLPSLAT